MSSVETMQKYLLWGGDLIKSFDKWIQWLIIHILLGSQHLKHGCVPKQSLALKNNRCQCPKLVILYVCVSGFSHHCTHIHGLWLGSRVRIQTQDLRSLAFCYDAVYGTTYTWVRKEAPSRHIKPLSLLWAPDSVIWRWTGFQRPLEPHQVWLP